MPKNKDLKRLVRSRMQKTGESYTAARRQVTDKTLQSVVPVARYAELAGMSDAAVDRRTGKTWAQWIDVLDKLGAASMEHRDIARYLRQDLQVPDWWAQTVTVGYERIKGLREAGQRRGGGFDVNKSKTLPVPVGELYQAFADPDSRHAWLGAVDLEVKKANADKSVRWTSPDETPVDVYFWIKGEAKSQVQLQHRGLPSKEAADEARALWSERLARLTDWLADPSAARPGP